MLVFATNKKSATHHPDAGVLSKFLVQDSLVAGAGLILKLRQSQFENQTILDAYFNRIFNAYA